MKISEYDAFGPWVYEITDEHPMPPLFVKYCQVSEDTRLQLKIPRNIERRNATPDMDLYDYVLSADSRSLTILERHDKNVTESVIAYQDILALRIFRKFLNGQFCIYTVENEVRIPFNTVSVDMILRLIGIIREGYLPAAAETHSPTDPNIHASFGAVDVLFGNLIRDMVDEGEKLTGGVYQPTIPLVYGGSGLTERIKNRMQKPATQSAAHLKTDDELIIIEREKDDGKKSKRGHGYEYMYIPLSNIDKIEFHPHNAYTGADELFITFRQYQSTFIISSDSSDLKAFYSSFR